jgi:hypothetical protein
MGKNAKMIWTPEREAAMKEIETALASCPEMFERCDADGTPNPKGTHWQLRDDAANIH